MCNYITDQLRWCDFNCHKWERFVTTNYTKSTTDHAMWQIWSSSHLTSNITWFVPISCHCFSDCSFIVMTICNNFAQISVIDGHLWLAAQCWGKPAKIRHTHALLYNEIYCYANIQSCKNVPTVPTSWCYFFWLVLIFGKSKRRLCYYVHGTCVSLTP